MTPIFATTVKISETEDRTVLDESTGALTPEPALDVFRRPVGDFAKYAQFYYSLLNVIGDCDLDKAEIQVLVKICLLTNSDGEVWLHNDLRDTMSVQLNMHVGTINNAISKLCKKPAPLPNQLIGVDYPGPILIRYRKGGYRINPLFLHKGSLDSRDALITSFCITYEDLNKKKVK